MFTTETKSKPRLGLDAGGVLFIHRAYLTNVPQDSDTSDLVWMPGCLATLPKLAELFELHVVSFAGRQTAEETKMVIAQDAAEWLPADRVHIVNNRLKKGAICAELKLVGMVDDRPDVLQAVRKDCPGIQCIQFDGNGKYQPRLTGKLPLVISWEQLESICRTLAARQK